MANKKEEPKKTKEEPKKVEKEKKPEEPILQLLPNGQYHES